MKRSTERSPAVAAVELPQTCSVNTQQGITLETTGHGRFLRGDRGATPGTCDPLTGVWAV